MPAPRGRPPSYTPDQRATVLRLHGQGRVSPGKPVSQAAIAAAAGLTERQVWRIINSLTRKPSPPPQRHEPGKRGEGLRARDAERARIRSHSKRLKDAGPPLTEEQKRQQIQAWLDAHGGKGTACQPRYSAAVTGAERLPEEPPPASQTEPGVSEEERLDCRNGEQTPTILCPGVVHAVGAAAARGGGGGSAVADGPPEAGTSARGRGRRRVRVGAGGPPNPRGPRSDGGGGARRGACPP